MCDGKMGILCKACLVTTFKSADWAGSDPDFNQEKTTGIWLVLKAF